jgi:hypothetical protein
MDIVTPKDGQVSELQVLKSNAGYYVGTTYYDSEMQGWFPYDRQSDYYIYKRYE